MDIFFCIEQYFSSGHLGFRASSMDVLEDKNSSFSSKGFLKLLSG